MVPKTPPNKFISLKGMRGAIIAKIGAKTIHTAMEMKSILFPYLSAKWPQNMLATTSLKSSRSRCQKK